MADDGKRIRAVDWMVNLGKAGVAVAMGWVIWASFLWAPSAQGFPGESSRIVFFHVPVAMVSFLAFLVAAVFSGWFLKSHDLKFDRSAAAVSGIGMVFSLLTTITGSIFAKAAWGTYWNWDPRETSMLMILFIYGAYFALRSAIEEEQQRAVLSAAFSLFAFATLPFLFFIMPRIMHSLHPSDTLSPGNSGMDATTMRVFLVSVLAHLGLFGWLLNLSLRQLRVGEAKS